jgi:hypothetical protein
MNKAAIRRRVDAVVGSVEYPFVVCLCATACMAVTGPYSIPGLVVAACMVWMLGILAYLMVRLTRENRRQRTIANSAICLTAKRTP